MPTIRQLPTQLINQIAAGEVIERPASVVKELIENSIDAGSRRIEVTITGGGSELIRVSDDGCGMTADQLPLAIASHATSKLPDDDSLFHVATLGFRGEAMASIASVSQLTIRSRTADCSGGSEIVVRGGQVESPAPCGCPVGTVIEVRNLFFNTPVRRKFMRSAQTENGHIVESFTRLALANPQIHMVMRSGDRVLYDLPPTTNWAERITAFFGDEIGGSLIQIHSDDGQVKVHGYVCDPSVSRGNARMQYLFLNGRHIRDRALQHALGEAYRGLLMVGRNPVCFLRLEMPPEMVDVNVHPTKLEVRFTDGGRVYARLLQSLRHRFLSADMTMRVGPPSPPRQDIDPPAEQLASDDSDSLNAGASAGPTTHSPGQSPRTAVANIAGGFGGRGIAGTFNEESPSESAHRQSVIQWAKTGTSPQHLPSTGTLPGSVPDFRPFPGGLAPWEIGAAAAGTKTTTSHPPQISNHADPGPDISHPSGASIEGAPAAELSVDRPGDQASNHRLDPSHDSQPQPPSHSYLGFQVHNRYLVTQDEAGMVVIDQHALHERVMYERIRTKVLGEGGRLESQRLLVPEPVSLTPAERAATLESKELLARVGIEIDDFGGDTILISAYPTMLRRSSPGDVLRQALESIIAAGKDPEARDLLDHLLHSMACKAAIKAGDRLSSDEITSLLEQRDLYQDTHHCPHGRPTALFFSRDELDRMFGRLGPRGRAKADAR
jgi:DNA mismatch repair protein MutL